MTPLDTEAETGLVWHYTDATGLLSIVSNHVLWATASSFLDDDQEVQLGYERILDRLVTGPGRDSPLARGLLEKLRKTQSEPESHGPSPALFFILSAAQEWDLLAMWRCYGGRGESYAIGLDAAAALPVLADRAVTSTDPFGLPLRQRSWTPVRYAPEEQNALADAVFDGLPEQLAELKRRSAGRVPTSADINETMAETLDDVEQALALIKHQGFSDERETRFSTILGLRPDAPDQWQGVLRYRASAYGIAPYLWLTGTDDGSHPNLVTQPGRLPIRAVAISPSPTGSAAEQSLRAMLTSKGYDVPVRRSAIPFRG